MIKVLVVSNCPSANTKTLQQSVVEGCRMDRDVDLQLRVRIPLDAHARDILWAQGVILGTTENFGYMSGQIKDFFERIYYPCLDKTQGKPVAIFVKGGLDGQGAKTSMERILTGLKWKLIVPTVVLKGNFKETFKDSCYELGATMVAGLSAGIY